MDWASILTISAINITLIGWLRQDQKDFCAELRAWRKDIDAEMKDFHGKLCELKTTQNKEG